MSNRSQFSSRLSQSCWKQLESIAENGQARAVLRSDGSWMGDRALAESPGQSWSACGPERHNRFPLWGSTRPARKIDAVGKTRKKGG